MKTIRFVSSGPGLFLAIGLLVFMLPGKLLALELVMFEQEACEWCEAWNEEISGVYPKTKEGKAAPLRRVDIFDPRPADLKKVRRINFTPTFVLMDHGEEVGRIQGYPGEDFFWGMLEQLITKAQKSAKAKKPTKSAS